MHDIFNSPHCPNCGEAVDEAGNLCLDCKIAETDSDYEPREPIRVPELGLLYL